MKSDNGTPAGLVCDECGFELGGGGKAKKDEPASNAEIVKAGASASLVSKEAIVRDVMKQRGGAGKGAAEVQASSVHEMALGEGSEMEHTELPPGEDEVVLKDGTRMVRRKKRKKEKDKHRKLYFFLTLWLGIAGAILVIVQLNKESDSDSADGASDAEIDTERRDFMFLQKRMPTIAQNFQRFIKAKEDDDRIQEIDFSAGLASKFSRFHQSQSFPVPVGKLSVIAQNVIELQKSPFAPAVEVVWRDEEGNILESVHVWDGKGWKLDWEHFSRYSTTPWTLFRARSGPKKEAEFRLLMRKRETLRESPYFSLLFYEKPALGVEDERKALHASESEEVIVKVRSDLGRKLGELFKAKEDGKKAYDSVLGTKDPETMIRVSAILAWEPDEDGEEVLVLKDLPGVSWYGSRVRRAYRQQQKLLEEENDDPVLPKDALKKEPLKE